MQARERIAEMLAGHGFPQGDIARHQGETSVFFLAGVPHLEKIPARLALFDHMVDEGGDGQMGNHTLRRHPGGFGETVVNVGPVAEFGDVALSFR